MKKIIKILIICIILALVILIGIIAVKKLNIFKKKSTELVTTDSITIVPTMNDTITSDSSWCGTFQLIWNDLKNEIVGKDIVFNPQLEVAENLNKEDFNESMLSEDYYFKICGLKTLEIKEQIKNGIKEKFDQTSDIIDDFDWSEDALYNPNDPSTKRYFLYTMLYRKFEFLKAFDKLEDGMFGDKYDNIKYFGIDENTENSVGDQIQVLYYNSKDDFAILINTKTNDEVIFCKNPTGNNFNEIYKNMNDESLKYKGNTSFNSIDEFKAPNLLFNSKKEYTDLEEKPFQTSDPIYSTGEIEKALQTVQFSLDENGGKIKSEAGMDVALKSSIIEEPKEEKPRYFYIDDTFAIFLREKGKIKPYFAGRIQDITKFQ